MEPSQLILSISDAKMKNVGGLRIRPDKFLFSLYFLSNLVSLIIYAYQGFAGDGELTPIVSIRDKFTLIFAGAAELAAFSILYLVWLKIVDFLKAKKTIKKITKSEEVLIGSFVLLCQLGYMFFVWNEGVGIAGIQTTTNSPWRFVWNLFPTDQLFMVFYCFSSSVLGPLNVLAYIFSGIIRGWSGVWLIVVLLYWGKNFCFSGIPLKKIFFIILIGFLLAPAIFTLRDAVRFSKGDYKQLESHIFVSQATNKWFPVVERLLYRFQHMLDVYLVVENKDRLAEDFESGKFQNFLASGIFQAFVLKNLGFSGPELNGYFCKLVYGDDFFANVGLISWGVFSPSFFPLFIFYSFVLIFLTVYFSFRLGGLPGCQSAWLVVVLYWLHGWYGAFLFFFQALLIIFALQLIIRNCRNFYPGMVFIKQHANFSSR